MRTLVVPMRGTPNSFDRCDMPKSPDTQKIYHRILSIRSALDSLILMVPTGTFRDELTEINIKLLALEDRALLQDIR